MVVNRVGAHTTFHERRNVIRCVGRRHPLDGIILMLGRSFCEQYLLSIFILFVILHNQVSKLAIYILIFIHVDRLFLQDMRFDDL